MAFLALCCNWLDHIQGIYANATMAERVGGGVRMGGGVHDSSPAIDTWPDRRDRRLLVSPPKDTGKAG